MAMKWVAVVSGFLIRICKGECLELWGLGDEEAGAKNSDFGKRLQFGNILHMVAWHLGLKDCMMVLSKTQNIKDVVAFPKTQNATYPLSQAPTLVSPEQL